VGDSEDLDHEVPPWLEDISGDYLPPLIESDAPLICVIAGPGSGKTTGIKRRVQRLIQGSGVPVDRIFVGTFTRAIARDLRAAVGQEIRVLTLHSLAQRLLRENPAALGARRLRFLLEFEENTMLYDVARLLPATPTWTQARRLLSRTQSARSERADLPDAAFAGQVEDWLVTHGAMLIGEVVPLATLGLEAHDIPPGQYDQVIIDEYQDLTSLEQQMVEQIWSGEGSLVVLGDDDQSIYSFRDNHPNGLNEFIQRWEDQGEQVQILPLPENRRSGADIVDLANTMMAEAGSVKDPMVAVREIAGEAIAVTWDSVEHEIAGLARYLRSEPETHFLVLVPRRFIGHRLRDAVGPDARTAFHQEDLEHAIVQERFTAAALLADEDDRIAFRAWLGFRGEEPVRADRRNTLAVASIEAEIGSPGEIAQAIADGDLPVTGSGRGNVSRRAQRLLELRVEAPADLRARIEYLFNPALAEAVEDEEKRRWIAEDLGSLREAALFYAEAGDDLSSIIAKLRYRIATRVPLIDSEGEEEARVQIMTLFSAKGLEADSIVLAGLADQIIPGPQLQDPVLEQQRRAEQRRLLYVSLTRARENLVISWPRSMPYRDASGNRIRRDEVFTDAEGELRYRLSRSQLLPNTLNAPVSGPEWFANLGA
jgi:superfamily I DNA/RNA helicase